MLINFSEGIIKLKCGFPGCYAITNKSEIYVWGDNAVIIEFFNTLEWNVWICITFYNQ